MKMKKLFAIAALVAANFVAVQAQEITPAMIKQAQEIVGKMTLEEKIDYIGGDRGFYIRPIARLGLPEVRMADGPQGVRNDTQSTMYPANILTTATWNRDMAYAMGAGIGIDCKTRGVNMILGPGVNIYRSPLAGRSFEYTGEDPYLASEAALGYVLGVQDQGIMACIKHYAANNQEWDRNFVSSDVDERTMQEIYLPTFRKAVEKGNVAAVMNSYNLLNNVWATEHTWLNKDVLRDQWGFKGMLMSDWGAVHDAIAPVIGGLDLEMPSGAWMNRRNLIPAIEKGVISEQNIDLMCEHIVAAIIAFGWLDNPLQADKSLPLDNPENCQRALDIAREGITLLKNNGNVLPLKGKTMVIGPNADEIVMGGGSGEVHPIHAVTLWGGLQTALGKKVVKGETRDVFRHISKSCFKTPEGQEGFKVEFFNNMELKGEATATKVFDEIQMNWVTIPADGIGMNNYSDRTTTVFTPAETGDIILEVGGDDGYRMFVDGKLACEDWHDHGVTVQTYTIKAVAGKPVNIVIEHYQGGGNSELYFDAKVYDEDNLKDPAYLAQFNKCDNIVVALGWNKKLETEGGDHNFTLPESQLFLLKEAANHGKNVILVLNGGGNPDVASLEPYADAIVMAYYPGQEGGTALAEILTGKVNPSGKLPYTIEKRWEDNPTYAFYYDKKSKDNLRVRYGEGVFVGYRGYDKNNTEVLYPFGYGLSYTTFEYSNLKVEETGRFELTVSFDVKNTGKVDGKEVCEVYVANHETAVPMPLKELKGFEKVFLKKGETKTVTVKLDKQSFEYYDTANHAFVLGPNFDFDILVGGSSRNLPLKSSHTFNY